MVIKPYYEHAGITIYHGDCLEFMRGVKSDSFEMMFTDPPYGVNYEGGHFHSGDANIKREREKLADDNCNVYESFIPEACRVVDGPCYTWFSDSKANYIYNAIIESKCDIHAMIIWNKTNATYAAMNAQYKQRHEPCLYWKPKGSTLRWCGPGYECTVWDMKRDPVNNYHPTQKPVSLATRAIRNHTAKSVFDPYMGAGSTLIAAKDLGRKAIGIEIEERYCEIAANRLSQEVFDFSDNPSAPA